MSWNSITAWFYGLGEQYGVDPLVFGLIYVGAIPFFTLSVGWIVRNLRAGRAVTLPVLSAGFFFVSAYLCLLVAGRNIPPWVYAVVVGLLAFGAWSTVRTVRERAGRGRAVSDQMVPERPSPPGSSSDGPSDDASP